MKPRCESPVRAHRIETVAYASRARCVCGWVSRFVPTPELATAAWERHRETLTEELRRMRTRGIRR